MEHRRSIVILDFGGQYAHLIASRVRRMGVFSEIREPETSAEDLKHAAGIILSGGPQSVYDKGSPQGDPQIFDLGVPVLGICYGLHWLTQTLGGEVKGGKVKEYGRTEIESTAPKDFGLLQGCPKNFTVWMSHGDEAVKLPKGFERIATSDSCENAAFADSARNFFALQFHPEVTHTEHGLTILKNFVGLCDADPWSIESYAKHIGEEIRRDVGDNKVFMLVSGGVDSTVAFTLLNEVLGADRVQGLLVDTGLMRKDEVKMIKDAFDVLGITNLHVEDASEEFFRALDNVYEPEDKRKAIGNTFLDVQKRVSAKMGLTTESGWMLGQGTIYPDTIETGATKHADQIKTHHNRVEAIQKMIDKGLVIEPLKDLYKDEVRRLGEELGLPHDLVWRHPFPGPGLGVRILCAKEAMSVQDAGLHIDVSHAVLPVKSVGVQGDGRTYRHALALFSHDPFSVPENHWKLATEIPNKNKNISRVVQCTSHSEVPSFVFTPDFLTRERADLLREADNIVLEEMRRSGLYESIWQFPVVLLPFGTTKNGQSIVLRPIDSSDAMTANASSLPPDVLKRMTERILKISGIDCVFYDLTSKPPGTIEWE
jgi:GMP synthase (glutamine-hydrolysing)